MNTLKIIRDPLGDSKDGHVLTRAIIDTIREPLIVLDENLCIIVASRSFYKKFHLTHSNTKDKAFYELGNGQWNIPALRTLLKQVIPKHKTVEGYVVEHDFPFLGLRTMLINAREINYKNGRKKMLLSLLDITHQKSLEFEKEKLLEQKDLLLKEMRHRIANSLQLISSILILKAGMVKSEESRFHLEDAHNRILTVATVQEQLDPTSLHGGKVVIGHYLTSLCESLSKSMIGVKTPISLTVEADKGSVDSDEAISFGLITTELVMNCLKHAFPNKRKGKILVSYFKKGPAWTLRVADDGVGEKKGKGSGHPGLGTGIISALAEQVRAKVKIKSSTHGMTVSLVHG